jgi:Cu-Zn family superoxide dismutase
MLDARSGSTAHGTVSFYDKGNGDVMAAVDIQGVTPGMHGFHIHEKGDCSAPDATSAGGHYNPTGAPHAAPDAAMHHMGDFGNVTANASGRINEKIHLHGVALSGENSIIGKSIVLHADRDDLTTQPSGNSGKRIACGVVEAGPMTITH